MITKGEILQILWTVSVWTRGLTVTAFVVAIFFGGDMYLKDIFSFILPFVGGSLLLHWIYLLVKFVFTRRQGKKIK